MQQLKYGLLACVVFLVMGCVSSGENLNVPVVDSRDEQPQGRDIEPQELPTIRNNLPTKASENPAILSLMKQASRQQQSGDNVGAARTLERAIRISPRYAELYYRLSEVRFAQQDFGQSEQLCRKAISLASGNSDLLARSRSLMAKAQQAQGVN